MAKNTDTCTTLTNITLEAFILNNCDRGKKLRLLMETKKAIKVEVKKKTVIPVLISYDFFSVSHKN